MWRDIRAKETGGAESEDVSRLAALIADLFNVGFNKDDGQGEVVVFRLERKTALKKYRKQTPFLRYVKALMFYT